MTIWPPRDDDVLLEQMRAAYLREVERAEHANVRLALAPRVRARRLDVDAAMLVLGAIAIVVVAAALAGQRGISPSARPSQGLSAPAIAASSTAAPASPSPGRTPTSQTFTFSAYEWLRSPVSMVVVDHSGLVVSARGIAEFELVPPARSGLAAVNRPPDQPSTSVVVLWPASSCDARWQITIDTAVRAITIENPDAMSAHCADLTGRAIVLAFSVPIDASRVAVSLLTK